MCKGRAGYTAFAAAVQTSPWDTGEQMYRREDASLAPCDFLFAKLKLVQTPAMRKPPLFAASL